MPNAFLLATYLEGLAVNQEIGDGRIGNHMVHAHLKNWGKQTPISQDFWGLFTPKMLFCHTCPLFLYVLAPFLVIQKNSKCHENG